jgi:hypothetical protein
MGHTGEIFLHPDCVIDLTLALHRDVHELRKPAFYAALRGRSAKT